MTRENDKSIKLWLDKEASRNRLAEMLERWEREDEGQEIDIWSEIEEEVEARRRVDRDCPGCEEANEIIAELRAVLTGLAGEPLTPCEAPCPGHLGSRGWGLMNRGLGKYREIVETTEGL